MKFEPHFHVYKDGKMRLFIFCAEILFICVTLIFSFYFSVAQCVAGRRPFTATLPIFMFIYNVCYTLLMALSGDGVVSNNEV